jgi:hypothetical protein
MELSSPFSRRVKSRSLKCKYVVNTQITNVAAMQPQTEMFARCIDQEIEMLRKEVLQSFALSAKAEKIAKSISKRKGKEVQRAILAKNVKWQAWFKELGEQVAKFLKARRLDAEKHCGHEDKDCQPPVNSIAVKGEGYGNHFLSAIPITSNQWSCKRNPSLSSLPETNEADNRQAPLLDADHTTLQSTLRMTGQS